MPQTQRLNVTSPNKYAHSLLPKLGNINDNLFFSPYNIACAFAMVMLGANGDTATELESLAPDLSSYEGVDDVTSVTTANAVWIQQGIKLIPAYEHALREFKTDLGRLDFESDPTGACEAVNAWVAKKTQGKIRDILPDVDRLDRLVIASAIYFKDSWEKEFRKVGTSLHPFYTTKGPKNVQMMRDAKRKDTRYWKEDDFAVAILPYRNPFMDMVIILPTAETSRPEVETELESILDDINSNAHNETLNISLPRFKMETNYDLVPTMKRLGVKQVFTDYSDLSAMSKDEPHLKVGGAYHKAFVDVNEEGTEAAAATGIRLMKCCASMGERVIEFKVDHPFLFTIRYDGAPLFVGRVTDPRYKG